jgi:glycosyltransferase involved in cell wall biosynthesis
MNNLKSILIIANSESVHTARFANEFAQRGFKVSLLSSTPYLGRIVNYDKSVNHLIFGATITNFFKLLFKKKMEEFNPANSSKLHPFNFLILFRMIYLFVFVNRIVKNVDFDAVFCTNLTTNALFTARINKNVKKVCQTLGCDLKKTNLSLVGSFTNNIFIYKYVESKLSYIIAGDEEYYHHFFSNERIFKNQKKIIKIRGLGVNVNRFSPKYKSDDNRLNYYNLTNNDILAVCFRQPRPKLAFKQILVHLEGIIKKHPNFYFAIGTGGVDFPELLKLVSKLGIKDNVLFMPNIPYENLHYYISQADIFIDPVNLELAPEMVSLGISGSVLEAMSCGVVPVIMKRPGLDVYFSGQLEDLVYDNMDSDLQNYIEKAIRNKKNKALKKELRDCVVKNSNWQSNIDNLLGLMKTNS